jgi:hypothetical protein
VRERTVLSALPVYVRLLLDGLRGLLDLRENPTEEVHDLVHLGRREVGGLRALAGADAELNAVILVHRDGRVEHVHRREHLGRLVDTILGVAGEGLDERREVGHRHLLRAGALATGEGEADDGDAVVIQTDLDALASGGEGGGIDRGREQLGHGDYPEGSRLVAWRTRGTAPALTFLS